RARLAGVPRLASSRAARRATRCRDVALASRAGPITAAVSVDLWPGPVRRARSARRRPAKISQAQARGILDTLTLGAGAGSTLRGYTARRAWTRAAAGRHRDVRGLK